MRLFLSLKLFIDYHHARHCCYFYHPAVLGRLFHTPKPRECVGEFRPVNGPAKAETPGAN